MKHFETLALHNAEAGSEISRLSGLSHYFKPERSYIFSKRPFYWLLPHHLTEPSPWVKKTQRSQLRPRHPRRSRTLSSAQLDQDSWTLAPIILMNTGSHRRGGQQTAQNVLFVRESKEGERAQWSGGIPRNVMKWWDLLFHDVLFSFKGPISRKIPLTSVFQQ